MHRTPWVSDLFKRFTVKNVLKFKKTNSNSLNFENNVAERNLIYKYIRFNIKTIKFRHKYK